MCTISCICLNKIAVKHCWYFFNMYDLAVDTDIVDTNVIDTNINLYAGTSCRHYQGRILG